MSVISNIVEGLIKSVVLSQARNALPAVGGALGALGVSKQVDPTQLEGALYYLVSSAFVIIPAVFSYLQHNSVQTLFKQALAATPGSPEAAAVQAKVS
jgi:hypothetical protein